jgi:hypothetical protein
VQYLPRRGIELKTVTEDFFPPVTLQFLKDLGRLTYRFLELFRHTVGLLGRVISPSQGLYLHRTTQHRKTRTNIHALSGIRTHDPSNQPAKTHASDRTATVTDIYLYTMYNLYIYVYGPMWEREKYLHLIFRRVYWIYYLVYLPTFSQLCSLYTVKWEDNRD